MISKVFWKLMQSTNADTFYSVVVCEIFILKHFNL